MESIHLDSLPSRMLIGGRLVDAATTKALINPAHGAVFADAPCACPNQMDAAIAAAASAADPWKRSALGRRRAAVNAWRERISDHRDRLAHLLTTEQGKPLTEAHGEIAMALGFLDHFVGLEPLERVLEDSPSRHTVERRVPLGVVGAIAAWNYPLALAVGKVAPAVLAGNTVVLKPAPSTPLTSHVLGELALGLFPDGVVNIVGDDGTLGPYLVKHQGVAAISFTGSTEIGRRIMTEAGPTLKRLTLELGGNDPAVVLEDADISSIAPSLFGNAFANAGQICRSIKRIYVHKNRYSELVEALEAIAAGTCVDDGFSTGVEMGPLHSQAQLDRVQSLVDDARAHGARVTGGDAPDRPGFFMRPAIVSDVPPNALLVASEQFGPALPIVPYEHEAEAVALANSFAFGLGASIWSGDESRALEMSSHICAGTVTVNQHMEAGGAHVPLAGARQSGIGAEFGPDALNEYGQIQVISVAGSGSRARP